MMNYYATKRSIQDDVPLVHSDIKKILLIKFIKDKEYCCMQFIAMIAYHSIL